MRLQRSLKEYHKVVWVVSVKLGIPWELSILIQNFWYISKEVFDGRTLIFRHQNHVNEDGPHVLIYYDSADEAGMIVAGDDFMEVYDSESLLPTVRSNRKAIMASAAAALVIGLVWYRSSRSQ